MIDIFHSLFLLLLNFLENLPNDCRMPAAVSSRAELHAVISDKCFCLIAALGKR